MNQEEIEFLNIVSIVAAQHDCTVDKIDLETRTISLTCVGGKAQEIKCAVAIGDIVNGSQNEVRFPQGAV